MSNKNEKLVLATTIGSSVTAATGGIITGVGFTSSGTAASSAAAAIQSGVGNVAAGSLFAALQSLGAVGVFAIMGVAGLFGVAGGIAYGGYKLATRNQSQ